MEDMKKGKGYGGGGGGSKKASSDSNPGRIPCGSYSVAKQDSFWTKPWTKPISSTGKMDKNPRHPFKG